MRLLVFMLIMTIASSLFVTLAPSVRAQMTTLFAGSNSFTAGTADYMLNETSPGGKMLNEDGSKMCGEDSTQC